VPPRSAIALWMLEELGEPCEIHPLSLKKKDAKLQARQEHKG